MTMAGNAPHRKPMTTIAATSLGIGSMIGAGIFALIGEPIGHSREGLVISGALIILMTDFFPLSEIAAVGSIAILIVHLITHLGHLRVRDKTGASLIIIWLAILAVLAAIGFAVVYSVKTSPHIVWFLAAALVCAFITEYTLHQFTARRIQTRVP